MKTLLFTISIFLISTSVYCQEKRDTLFVYFPFDQFNLTLASKQELNLFIQNYKNDTNISLLLKGHCDNVGSHAYNDELSKNRSHSVYDYLVTNGVPETSIQSKQGFGERIPLLENNTPEQRAKNRRVEIIWQKQQISVADPKSNPDPEIKEDPEPKQDPRIVPVIPQDTISVFSKKTIDTAQIGTTLRLRNINFYGGRHTFLPQSTPALQELLEVMKSNPKLEIEIQGHICCRHGSEIDGLDYDSGDDRLSYNRARAVYYYLANNGIGKRRMNYKGFAGKYPLVSPELTDEDRTRNRRVEIKILKK